MKPLPFWRHAEGDGRCLSRRMHQWRPPPFPCRVLSTRHTEPCPGCGPLGAPPGGPSIDVEDAVQKVFFLVVSRRLDSFHGEARFSTWLFETTRKVVATTAAVSAGVSGGLTESWPSSPRRCREIRPSWNDSSPPDCSIERESRSFSSRTRCRRPVTSPIYATCAGPPWSAVAPGARTLSSASPTAHKERKVMSDLLRDPPRWKDRADQARLVERAAGQLVRAMGQTEPLSSAQLARIASRVRAQRSTPPQVFSDGGPLSRRDPRSGRPRKQRSTEAQPLRGHVGKRSRARLQRRR